MIETERLILRGWRDGDVDPFNAMCRDPEVMRYLGPLASREESAAAIARQNEHLDRLGYCFWAVERRDDGALLGFCGIKPGAPDTPIERDVEIGWRLARAHWGRGYAYAHWLGRIAPRWQAAIHLTVLVVAALWLPIGLNAMELPADAQPALWVPWLLGLSLGPLFFAVSAQAPLLQRWFSISSAGQDPYALYAASNFGSFAGLIAYPLIVEPGLALR